MGVGPHDLTPAELARKVAADRDGRPYLLLRDDDGALLVRPLDGTQVTIGRLPESDLCLHWDGRVSRTHAQLEAVGGRWTVVDGGLSRNGTFVNDRRVSARRALDDGDVLRFGGTVIVYHGAASIATLTDLEEDLAGVLSLSAGQRRVLVALCRPLLADDAAVVPATNPEIAAELTLTVEGVRTHMRALFDRFGLEDLPRQRKRSELARRAIQAGIVTRQDL